MYKRISAQDSMSGKLFAAAWSLKDATTGSVVRSLPTKCWNEFGPLTFGFALACTRARVFLAGTQFTPRRFDTAYYAPAPSGGLHPQAENWLSAFFRRQEREFC